MTRSPGRMLLRTIVAAAVLASSLFVVNVSPASAAHLDIVISRGHTCSPFDLGFAQLNAMDDLLLDTARFGPTGTVEVSSLTLKAEAGHTGGCPPTDPPNAVLDAAYLADVDIYIDGWMEPGPGPGWQPGETDALLDWINAGGVAFISEDRDDADTLAEILGLPVTGVACCDAETFVAEGDTHPVIAGPFGTWTTVPSGGTSGEFATVPAGWTVLARNQTSSNPVLLYRQHGGGHIILSADEGMIRPLREVGGSNIASVETLGLNIMAFMIGLVESGGELFISEPGDQNSATAKPLSLQLTAGGGDGSDITWTVDQLPTGLMISSTTGEITGTPSVAGENVTVTVTATPLTGTPDSATFQWTTEADTAPSAMADTVNGQVGVALSFDVCSNDSLGNTPSTVVFNSALPSGLSANNCVISGTPSAISSAVVNYTLTDGDGDNSSVDATFDIIAADLMPVAVDDTINGQVGVMLSMNICTNDTMGDAPTVASLDGALPGDLSQSGADGCTISGTPNATSSAMVGYTLTDNDGDTDAATITFNITDADQMPDAVDDTVNGQVGVFLSVNICTNDSLGDSPTTAAANGALPTGLGLSGSGNCVLSGTPSGESSAVVGYTLTDNDGDTDVANITFNITTAPPQDQMPNAVDDGVPGTVGTFLSVNICGNDDLGDTPTAVTLNGALPAGLTQNGCVISGTPTAASGAMVGYTLTDNDGDTDSATISFDIAGSGPCSVEGDLDQLGPAQGTGGTGDEFGAALASGDFDGDGDEELAVGAPGRNANRGAVWIFEDACSMAAGSVITQAGPTPGKPRSGDRFGAALVAGNFNGDQYTDLAIGVPGERVNKRNGAGVVLIMYGSATGLTNAGAHNVSQRGPAPNRPQAGDGLGSALASGNFDGDDFDDLLIGVPGEDIGGRVDAGAVQIHYGSGNGITDADAQFWKQRGRLKGRPQAGDALGSAVAAGDVNGDGFDDAVFSAPLDDFANANGGVVHVLRGSANGTVTAGQQQFKTGALQARWGWSLAVGEINGDTFADLVVGVRGNDARGQVRIYKGGSTGLTFVETFDQSNSPNSPRAKGDRLGQAVAIVDIDGDQVGEVAIGVPGEKPHRSGAVHVLDVNANGVVNGSEQYYTLADAGGNQTGALFGLAMVDVDGVLVIGSPGQSRWVHGVS